MKLPKAPAPPPTPRGPEQYRAAGYENKDAIAYSSFISTTPTGLAKKASGVKRTLLGGA